YFFFFQAEDGIRDRNVTGVQTCALPISCQSALHHLLKHCAGVPKFITASKPSSRPKAWAPDSVTRGASHPSLIRTARRLRSSSKPSRKPVTPWATTSHWVSTWLPPNSIAMAHTPSKVKSVTPPP